MTIIQADASPEKSLFLEMFIRDLSLEDCILDLIDNSLDSLIRTRKIDVSDSLLPVPGEQKQTSASSHPYEKGLIDITYDLKSFNLVDTCGGISIEEAKNEVFRFGHKADVQPSQLGVYGIGLKRAIFKIGNAISISSHTEQEGFKTHIDVPKWAKDRNWFILLEPTDLSSNGLKAGTSISISQLRPEVVERIKSGTFAKHLYDMIAGTYCLFLDKYLKVTLNGYEVKPLPIPLARSENVNIAKEEFQNDDVTVTLYAGLAARDAKGEWRASEAGWYAACNGRLVVSADKTDLTGWGKGPSPMFVPKYRGFVGVIFFYSQNTLSLPWTTMKRGLNRESMVFQKARGRMANLARPVLRFLDEMYSTKEIEREPQRLIAEQVQLVDVRNLSTTPSSVFNTQKLPPSEHAIRVQYDAKDSELQRIRKVLNKSSWSAKKIGRFTFEHYLKMECPE